MDIEKIEKAERSVVKPGKNLGGFIENAQTEAVENGEDGQAGALRRIMEDRKTGKIGKLINSDIKNVSDSSTSSK